MKDCTTCKYGYKDEQLGIPMCHHPKRFSEDCVDFDMHEEKEPKESEKPMNPVCEELEKEIERYFPESAFSTGWNYDDMQEVARHFYELGHKEEPVCDELEEAAKGYRETKIANGYFFKIKGTKPLCYLDDLIPAFIAGANWQKGHITKVVERYVEKGDRCMDESEKQPEFEFWDGFHNCAENILRELKDYRPELTEV